LRKPVANVKAIATAFCNKEWRGFSLAGVGLRKRSFAQHAGQALGLLLPVCPWPGRNPLHVFMQALRAGIYAPRLFFSEGSCFCS